ncbi:MAG: leucine-rich repeat domain-containing protein [Prevotella sp.]|nr:leucine-rich repeat domain-containing protein [Prevotella sp.]
MRHQRYIILLVSMLLTLTVRADYELGTITLDNDGKTVTAEALIDNGSHIVILGNGQNACIPQYTAGTLTIPGSAIYHSEKYGVKVGQLAFRLCNSLTEVVMEEGVSSIGDFAFVGCSSLQKITLPSSVSTIGSGAFVNLTSLKEMKCGGSEAPSWLYKDVFAYEGTVEATSDRASERTLYVPLYSSASYRRTKYGDVGWEEAFGLISENSAPTKTMEVSTFEQLLTLSNRVNSGDNMGDYVITLTADLIHDTSGSDDRINWRSWVPIGTAEHPFMGVFNGGGHTIKNVKNAGDGSNDNVGLFGYTKCAQIGNLCLQNVSMIAHDNVGVVVGHAVNTHIHDILIYDAKSSTTTYYCANAVSGSGNAGGIVGNAKDCNIDDCYFYGKVKGNIAGGIIGLSQGDVTVSDCAVAYSVEGTTIGGVVGKADTHGTSVERSYSRATLTGTITGGLVGDFTDGGFFVHTAFLDPSGTMEYANGNYVSTSDNLRCSAVSEMEGFQLIDQLLYHWYYFHDESDDCPVPKSLAEQYMEWAGMKDANGFVYKYDDTISGYIIVGYTGSATDITLPSTYKGVGVKKVADRVFAGSNLTRVVIPDELLYIGKEAFADCKELTSITIGKLIEAPYNGWLDGCDQLTDIHVSESNTSYKMENGVLYTYDMTTLIRCPISSEDRLTVPSSVTSIAPGAFANCDKLMYVDLRDATTLSGTFDRKLPTNPFYLANKYTVFFLNNNYTHNYQEHIAPNEPNVVYYDGTAYGYVCDHLLITDHLDFVSPIGFKSYSAQYDREFIPGLRYVEEGEGYYEYVPKAYTFCLPFTPTIFTGKGVKLYTFDGVVTENDVTIAKFSEPGTEGNHYRTHPGFPYMMVVESGDMFQLDNITVNHIQENGDGGSLTHDNYKFQGSFKLISNTDLYDADHPKYILQSDGNWHKVPQNQPKAFVGAFRSYFIADASSTSRQLVSFFGEETTPIQNTVIRTTDKDGTQYYYDLNGRRLNGKPQRGLYIYNGHTYHAKP